MARSTKGKTSNIEGYVVLLNGEFLDGTSLFDSIDEAKESVEGLMDGDTNDTDEYTIHPVMKPVARSSIRTEPAVDWVAVQ